MDLHPSEDMYESFRKYQSSLLAQFDTLAQEYDFEVIDASADVRTIFAQLKLGIARVLDGRTRERQPLLETASGAKPVASESPVIEVKERVSTPVTAAPEE